MSQIAGVARRLADVDAPLQALQWLLLASISKRDAADEPDKPEAAAQDDKRHSKGAVLTAMGPCQQWLHTTALRYMH